MAALDSLLGNETLRESLSAALRAGRLSHSILLYGEPGTGAGFAARCLAADYLYPDGGPGAAQVLAGKCPECLTLAGEGSSGQIPVERVRAVRREIYATALSAQGRAVLVYGADRLNAASANALLKVLEEPPEGALFVLTAPGEAAVLPTLRSRCCAYTLAPVSEAVCAAYLKREFPRETETERYAALFGGKIGAARACLASGQGRALLEDALRLAELAQQRDVYGALALLAHYEKERARALELLALLGHVCAAALRGAQAARSPLDAARAAWCGAQAARAEEQLRGNGNTKLTLTCLAARLAA